MNMVSVARQRCFFLLLTAYCVLLVGCVRRSLTIKTEPSGALVYVNDELKGKSPVSYDFAWYGWYRVMARKDGFARLDDRRLLRCPVYLWVPFDLAMELLPLPIRDRRVWSYTLTPAPLLPNPTAPEPETGASGPAPAEPVVPPPANQDAPNDPAPR